MADLVPVDDLPKDMPQLVPENDLPAKKKGVLGTLKDAAAYVVKPYVGLGEAVASNVSGVVAPVLAGYRGLYDLARTGSMEEAEKGINEVQNALTYKPQTEMGKYIDKGIGKVTHTVFGKPVEIAGDIGYQAGGPIGGAVGAGAMTVGEILMFGRSGKTPKAPYKPGAPFSAEDLAVNRAGALTREITSQETRAPEYLYRTYKETPLKQITAGPKAALVKDRGIPVKDSSLISKETRPLSELPPAPPAAETSSTPMVTIRNMLENGEPVNPIHLNEYLKRGGEIPDSVMEGFYQKNFEVPYDQLPSRAGSGIPVEDPSLSIVRRALEEGSDIPQIHIENYLKRGGKIPENRPDLLRTINERTSYNKISKEEPTGFDRSSDILNQREAIRFEDLRNTPTFQWTAEDRAFYNRFIEGQRTSATTNLINPDGTSLMYGGGPSTEQIMGMFKGVKRGVESIFAAGEGKRALKDLPNLSTEDQAIVNGIGDMYNSTRQALSDRGKTSLSNIRDLFTRAVTDVTGNLKRELVNKGGELGRQAAIDRDLVAGSSGKAGRIIEEVHDNVYGSLNNKGMDLLDEIIQSRRTIDIDSYKQGVEHPGGWTGEQHKVYLENFAESHGISPQEFADLNARADNYFTIMKDQLKELYDNGLITDTAYEELKTRDYSKREFINHIDPEIPMTIGGKRINVTESGIKSMKEGSTELLENNSERLMAEVVSRTQNRVFKNRANQSLYDLALNQPENGIVSIKPFKGSTELSMYKDGSRYTFHIDGKMAEDWVTRDPLINQTTAEILQWVSGAKLVKATATGYNPIFALKNLPRDIALIWTSAEGRTAGYSSTLPKFMTQMGRDLLTVMPDVLKRKGRVIDAIDEGLGSALLTHYGKFRGQGALIEKVNSLSDLLSWAGETSELWTRLALRERAMRNGVSSKEATWLARNYLDFSQGGNFVKTVDNVIPYFNAGIQGTRSLFRGARTDPKRFTYQVAQLGTIATGLYLANAYGNPECWKAVNEKDKEANFIVCTPFQYTDDQGQERYFYGKIPKDQGQRIFATAFEALAAKWVEGKVPVNQLTNAANEFVNLDSSKIVPPTIKSVLSYMLNKDFYTKEDAWRGMPNITPTEEYSNRTDPLAVSVGHFLGLSPERTRVSVRSIISLNNPFLNLGGLGLKTILGQLPKEAQNKAVKQMIAENPSFKAFIGSTSPYNEYREDMDKAKELASTQTHKINREFDALLETFLKNQTDENAQKIVDMADKLPEYEQDRLTNRAERRINYLDVPDKTWWLNASELTPEAKAEAFYKRYQEASKDPEEQRRLLELCDSLPGFSSDRFIEKMEELLQE